MAFSRPAPKPALNAWIQAERRRMGWKVEELSDRLKALGCDAEPNTIRVWEGRKPNPPRPGTVDALEALFGSRAPGDEKPGHGDVAGAIDRQTRVLERIAAALERMTARG